MAKGVSSTLVIITSCAPPILYPSMYEIDMLSQAVLMTHRRMAEATDAIGLDLVILQTLQNIVARGS